MVQLFSSHKIRSHTTTSFFYQGFSYIVHNLYIYVYPFYIFRLMLYTFLNSCYTYSVLEPQDNPRTVCESYIETFILIFYHILRSTSLLILYAA